MHSSSSKSITSFDQQTPDESRILPPISEAAPAYCECTLNISTNDENNGSAMIAPPIPKSRVSTTSSLGYLKCDILEEDFADASYGEEQQVRADLESFFLNYAPTDINSIDEYMHEYEHFGIDSTNAKLLSTYNKNLRSLPKEKPPQDFRKLSYQERFGVSIAPTNLLSEMVNYRKPSRKTSAASSYPTFELDINAQTFGACRNCGVTRQEHTGVDGKCDPKNISY